MLQRMLRSRFRYIYAAIVGCLLAVLPGAIIFLFPKKIKYTSEKKILIKEATVLPTSFNEQQKTQIRSEDYFFVVYGFPQVSLKDSLSIRLDGKEIVSFQEPSGKWYSAVR